MTSAFVAGDDLAVMYDRMVGTYNASLAGRACEILAARMGSTAAVVNAATGHLAAALGSTLGAPAVVAAESNPALAEACMRRADGVSVETAPATALPWNRAAVDIAVCAGDLESVESIDAVIAEMRRVTRAGGTVAAIAWDYETMTLLHAFWTAAIEVDPIRAVVAGQGSVTGQITSESLSEMWTEAGLSNVSVSDLVVSAGYSDADEAWAPFLSPITTAGAYLLSLDVELQERIRVEFVKRIGNPSRPFSLRAGAFLVSGTV